MFKIIGKDIHITRGDSCTIRLSSKSGYTFQEGDVIRINIFRKKGCSDIEKSKDIIIEKTGTKVDLPLTKEDTTIGPIINKPVEHWYEIELNPNTYFPQTIIGYNDEGPTRFILYPEGDEENL